MVKLLIIHGAETWAMKENRGGGVGVARMRCLRIIRRLPTQERLRIEDIKKEIKVVQLRKTITKKNEMVWPRKENGGKWMSDG